MPRFQYDPAKGKFRSYLKTVVLHTIYRKSRQKRGEAALEELAELADDAAADPATDEQWEAEWRQYHLRWAARTIEAEFNETDRNAFDAYAVRGRDAAQIARALGISVAHVYQAKSRILKRLGQLIEHQVREEG